jgi:hypothetical protein
MQGGGIIKDRIQNMLRGKHGLFLTTNSNIRCYLYPYLAQEDRDLRSLVASAICVIIVALEDSFIGKDSPAKR